MGILSYRGLKDFNEDISGWPDKLKKDTDGELFKFLNIFKVGLIDKIRLKNAVEKVSSRYIESRSLTDYFSDNYDQVLVCMERSDEGYDLKLRRTWEVFSPERIKRATPIWCSPFIHVRPYTGLVYGEKEIDGHFFVEGMGHGRRCTYEHLTVLGVAHSKEEQNTKCRSITRNMADNIAKKVGGSVMEM